MKEEKHSFDAQVKLDNNKTMMRQKTPIEESIKYLHLRNYLINAKKIRETWISNSTQEIKQS